MRRLFGLAPLLLLVAASPTFGQAVTSGTGAINGRVTDNSQAVIPGVTITITSPSQMGTRTTVTDNEGQYRFTAVPPGDYVVLFELAGFRAVRNEGIRVGVGFTATVNAELKVASLEESVTVTGQSPVVDTSATQVGNTFNAEQLSALPTSRDYFSLLAGSPAVQMNRIDVGGSTNGTQQGFTTYGTTGQVRASIEGINATENTGAFGNYPDVGGMEEVVINTAAHSAEASTPGVQSQFISKSGGNEYRGTFFGGYSPESWQSFNIDEDQISRGLQGGGGLDPEDVNRLLVVSGREHWFRRVHRQGSPVVVRVVPASGHQSAIRQLPCQAADDDPQQLQPEAHLQPVAESQDPRLHAAVAEEAAAALRLVPAGRRHRDQYLGSDDLEPELLGVGAQGRMERRAERQRVCRDSRRSVRLRLDQRRQRHRSALRGYRQQPDPRA